MSSQASKVTAEKSPFASVEDALAAIARGEPVVVVDDADRENEGDVIMAAELVTTEQEPRITDLSEVPSPFLEGIFEKNKYTWMVFETNRGCPFKCNYCYWGAAIGAKVFKYDNERLQREICGEPHPPRAVAHCCRFGGTTSSSGDDAVAR